MRNHGMIYWNRELTDHINARVSKKFHVPLANEASVCTASMENRCNAKDH